MAQEAIIIQIDLETNVVKAFEQIGKSSEDIGQKISKNISGKLEETTTKASQVASQNISSIDKTTKNLFNTVKDTLSSFDSIAATLTKVGTSTIVLTPIVKNFKDILSLTGNISKTVLKSGGLFGLTSNLATVSAGLFAIAVNLEKLDSKLADTIASGLKFTSIVLGGVSAALSIAIVKAAELGEAVGAKLAAFFVKSSTAANEFEDATQILTAAIDAVNRSIGTNLISSERWIAVVDKVAQTFNLSSKEVTKAAQEILLVGTKLGLNADQLEKLIKVSAEYAKINKKDVFQTSVNLVSALNGNAQSVQALGIKLGEASVQQFAYTQGITKSIQKLSENEIVQLRYNKLLKEYKQIAGLGAIAAGTLADQQVRLENNQKRLSASLGAGARIIEQNNILAFGLNLVLDNISDSVLKVTGFFGALGARLLQFGSIIFGLSFKIFAVVKVLKILQLLLASKIGESFFTATIPIIGKSLDILIARATLSTIKVRSLTTATQALALAIKVQLGQALLFINGAGGKTITLMSLLTGVFQRFKDGLALAALGVKKILALLAPFGLVILKIGAIIALILAPFYALYKALQIIENQTKIFSTLYELLKESISGTGSALAPAINFFTKLKDKIVELSIFAFGKFVDGVAKVVGVLLELARKNPFNAFSKKTIDSLTQLDGKLKGFRGSLAAVAFDVTKLSGDMSRSLASVGNGINIEELARNLEQVRSALENAGLSQGEIIKKTAENQRLIIKQALDNNLLDRQEYSNLLIGVAKEEQLKLAEINKKNASGLRDYAKEINESIGRSAVQTISSAFQSIGKSLVDSGDDFKGFLGTVLNILGDLAISIGTTVIASSKAIEALKTSLFTSSAAPIALGGALIAIGAALKVFGGKFGGQSSGSIPDGSGGGGGGIAGGASAPSTSITQAPQEDRRSSQTQVQLIVQGDVLDSQESGTRIAKILSDAFSRDGIVLNNGAVS